MASPAPEKQNAVHLDELHIENMVRQMKARKQWQAKYGNLLDAADERELQRLTAMLGEEGPALSADAYDYHPKLTRPFPLDNPEFGLFRANDHAIPRSDVRQGGSAGGDS